MNEHLPIDERIVEDIVEAVGQISVLAGYHCDLKAQRAQVLPTSPEDGLAVVMADDPEPMEESPCLKQDWTMRVAVTVYAIEDEDSEVPLEQRLRVAAADIRSKLKSNNNRSALAIRTNVATKDQTSLAPPAWIQVPVEIWFRTAWDDPYSL